MSFGIFGTGEGEETIGQRLIGLDRKVTTARGPEIFLALWVRMFGITKSGNFNVKGMVAKQCVS